MAQTVDGQEKGMQRVSGLSSGGPSSGEKEQPGIKGWQSRRFDRPVRDMTISLPLEDRVLTDSLEES